MPTVLREHQHELNLPDSLDDGFVFGTEDTGYLTLSRPASQAAEQTNADRTRAQEDGTMFGHDFRGSKALIFEIGVLTDHLGGNKYRDNLDYLDALEVLWQHRKWRNSPDAMAMLRSCEAGQTWRCYGRPRRYEEVVGKMTAQGYSNVVADFMMIDNSWYSDVEHVHDLFVPSGPEGGLAAPFSAPLSSVQASAGNTVVTIGGSKETWPVFEFHGPVVGPQVTIGDLSVGLDVYLEAGQAVVYDPRPWVRSVYALGAPDVSYAGYLTTATPRMQDVVIDPGTYEVEMGGLTGGGAFGRLRWRDARARP